MNKPIINGIDVSECCFYNNGKCNNPNGMACNCINNAVCYFKELKRLQQELDIKEKMLDKFMIGSGETLEKLQKENEGLKSLNDFNVQKIEVLQEENEKLKANKERCAFKCLDNTFCDEAKIKIDKLELDKDCLNASLETARKYRGIAETDRDKYKQALEEIRKEYTNSIFYQCDKTEEECPCHNCIILGQLDRVQNIVKIVDEALNDRN